MSPLYAGGRYRGELRSAEADIQSDVADAQIILDAISLQVNVAYRGVIASRERIDLARTAITQSEENMRLLRVRYRNGNATPTDIVDSEAAFTPALNSVIFRPPTRTWPRWRGWITPWAANRVRSSKSGRRTEVQQPWAPEELPTPLRLPAIQ